MNDTPSRQHETSSNDHARGTWSRQVLAYALFGGILLYILLARFTRPLVLDQPPSSASSRAQMVEQRIDPNRAGWAEWARLPGLGETLAKRIVAYRQERQAGAVGPAGNPLVFHAPDDLGAIPGLTPNKLEQIAPYIKFPPGDSQTSY